MEMENILNEKRVQRKRMHKEVQELEKVDRLQERALGVENVKRSKGNKQIKQLTEEKQKSHHELVES
jgi:hypothetical protein